MKIKRKALILFLCVATLVVGSVFGTMAYLTDTEMETNTFTVGEVKIKLDETSVNPNGIPKESSGRIETGNTYHLIPGHRYTKDPMVTVLQGSKDAYIRMQVTVNCMSELDTIGIDLMRIFEGYNGENWLYKGNTKDVRANTRTYEFWYKETVAAPNGDIELDPLFDAIVIPEEITGQQLATLDDLHIYVVAHAIQADGFADAGAAWKNFPTN